MSLQSKMLKLFSPRFAFYIFAKRYIQQYEGFSYNFKNNGEEYLLEALNKFEIKNVFDVGANVGNWTQTAMNKFLNARIHAFELSQTTYETLFKNLSDCDRVILNNVGLSNDEGIIEYKDYGRDSGVNTILTEADFHDSAQTMNIKKGNITTGDKYCSQHNVEEIDFLKIDVEGAEHLVLEGFAEKLRKGKIKVIQFEYGYTHADAKFLIKDFYKLLSEHKYVIGPLKPSGVLFMDFDYALNGFNSGPNYVAVHQGQKEVIEAVKGEAIKGFPLR